MYRVLSIMDAMEKSDKPYIVRASKHVRTAYINPKIAKKIEKEKKDADSKRV